MSKASSLEAMSLNTLEGDRRLRALAPPRDWESIAAEGALRLQQKWEADPGGLVAIEKLLFATQTTFHPTLP